MTTQYSPILKLALPVQGELSGTWGDVVNDNITSMVEQAIAGRAVIDTWTTNSHSLTSANGTTSESRCAMLELTDTGTALSGAGTVICPALSKIYIVKNAAGQNITVKTASGTGILVPDGRTTFLFCDGTNVVEALTHTTSLQLGTSTTVTAVLDEDNMASDSPTSLATQQSIKAYVDSKVGQFDSLAEVLAVGNTTGANDIIVDNGQKITTNTIDETTAGSGVTIDSVLLKDDGVNATNLEVTNIKANDGTAALSIADTTGQTTITDAVLTTADINGGTADGVVIGGSTPAAATVTTATANTSLNIAGTTTVTSILDEDNMSSNDPAGLATQQSIKAYVDAQVGTADELSEVLANGNTTGANDIIVDSGQKITTNTIDETTAGSGVTIDSVLLKDDVVNATDVETGSISANDGTTAATIANSTGVVTVPSAVLTTADINGGTADGVVIGGATPAAITGTTVVANTSLNIAGDGATVTGIKDEDDMASNSATKLATQQSIKAYVDAQVGTVDTLAEVLANGNTTGGTDIAVSAGDDITFTNSSKAIFGTGSSLEIFGDGANSYIKDAGTGNLYIQGSNLTLEAADGTNYMAADDGVALYIYHPDATNQVKLNTTATGINVTGTAVTDGLTVAGNVSVDGGTIKLDGNYPVGSENVALGDFAFGNLTSGGSNTAVGRGTLYSNQSGGSNSAFGTNALVNNVSGGTNTAIGATALNNNNTASANTAVGYQALYSNTSGTNNVGIGFDASYSNQTSGLNTAVGYQALYYNTANYNTAFGHGAGKAITTGTENLALGRGSMRDSAGVTGNSNTGVGNFTLNAVTSGTQNLAVGAAALTTLANGNYNTAVGYNAGYSQVSASFSTMVGYQAGYNTTSASKVLVGYRAGYLGVNDGASVFIGSEAGYNNETYTVTAVGSQALKTNTSGYGAVAIGDRAQFSQTSGFQNSSLGALAGYTNQTGDNNVSIGTQANYHQTGSANTAVGSLALNGQAGANASSNTAVGYQSMYYTNTGGANTSVGHLSGHNIRAGTSNVAVGYYSLVTNQTGIDNTAVGRRSLSQTTSNGNTGIGYEAGYNHANATRGVFVGYRAGYGSNYDDVTAIGYAALGTYQIGGGSKSKATAIGSHAGEGGNSTTGGRNQTTYVGADAGRQEAHTTGNFSQNVAVGEGALRCSAMATGAMYFNTAVGVSALAMTGATSGTSAVGNTAVGQQALQANSGSYNTALGINAGITITSGGSNTSVGAYSLEQLTTGIGNQAIGHEALRYQTQGTGTNIALGHGAGRGVSGSATGNANVFIGQAVGYQYTTASGNVGISSYDGSTQPTFRFLSSGSNNVAIGKAAGASISTGVSNVMIGTDAGKSMGSNNNNVAIGLNAMRYMTTGGNNVAIGYNAMGDGADVGLQNVVIGYRAGEDMNNPSSSNTENTLIGYLAGGLISTGVGNTNIGALTNEYGGQGTRTGIFSTMIGAYCRASGDATSSEMVVNAPGSRNPTTGKGSNTGLISANGASGSIYQGNNSSSWATTSDRRLKKNIVDSTLGLAEINQLRVRNFEYRTVDEVTDFEDHTVVEKSGVQVGVIAQEIQEVFPNCVREETTGVMSVDPDNLTWHLIKAVQELSAKNDALEARIANLEG